MLKLIADDVFQYDDIDILVIKLEPTVDLAQATKLGISLKFESLDKKLNIQNNDDE